MNARRRTVSRAIVVALLPVIILAGCGDDEGGATAEKTTKKVATDTDDRDAPSVLVTPKTTGGDTAPDTIEDPTSAMPSATSPAEHRIVPATSIDLVELDMRRDEVEQRFGAPRKVVQHTGELGATTELQYGSRTVIVDPETGLVIRIDTTDPEDATVGGVMVGSRIGDVRLEFPQADCADAGGAGGVCRVLAEDGVVTDFFIDGGRVSRVVVGYIRD